MFGWETTKKNLWFYVGLIFIFGIINYVPDAVLDQLPQDFSPFIFFILFILIWAVQLTTQVGLTYITLRVTEKKKPMMQDLFLHYRLAIAFFIASAGFWLIVVSGTLLLIIPGIILAIRLSLFGYEVAEGTSHFQALKNSWKITRGSTIHLFLFGLSLAGLNIIGALALGVGLFLTIPTSILASAYVYKKLRG